MQANLFSASPREQAIDALHRATAIYTAEPVVDELLDRLDWPRGDRRLADPSCGDGMFLGQALKRLLDAQPDLSDAAIAVRIEGWEIHPEAAAQARERVAARLVAAGRAVPAAQALAHEVVRNADFLTAGPRTPRYHTIASNPPYLRFVNVPEVLRDEYTAILPTYACGDLLYSFLDRCAAVLHGDGEIALVTADRWLFNQGARGLRSALGARLGIHHLARLDASTAFYRPKQRRAGSAPRIHPVAVVMRPGSDVIRLAGGAPIYPGEPADGPSGGVPLAEVARVRLAPWMGSPGIFVVTADVAAGLPPEYLVPAVDTDDIVDGVLQTPKRFAIRTEREQPPPAAVLAHLDAHLPRMAARGRQIVTWLPPEPFHRFALDQPSLLIPRIARGLKPVQVPPGILPINHNLSIVSAGAWSLEKIERALSTPEAERWVRARAPRLEGGFHSLTTTLLRQLPLADVA